MRDSKRSTSAKEEDYVPRTMRNCFGDQILCDSDLSNKHCGSNCLELRVGKIREKRRCMERREVATFQSTGEPQNRPSESGQSLSLQKKLTPVCSLERNPSLSNNPSTVSTSTQATYEPSETTKAFIKFKRNVQHTLSTLNDEMSNALRNGVSDINDICYKVRQCLSEMEENDKNYWKLRALSTPDLIPLSSPEEDLTEKAPLESFTTPILTQSENQVRIVLDSNEKTLQDDAEESKKRSLIRFTVKQSMALTSFQPTTYHDRCTVEIPKPNNKTETIVDNKPEKQELSKRESKQEPAQANLDTKPEKDQPSQPKQTKKTAAKQPPAVANTKRATKNNPALKPDLDMPPFFHQVGNEKFESIVSRCRGLHDIHERLLKQMDACDSLCEFERKMLYKPSHTEILFEVNSSGDKPKEHEVCKKCSKCSMKKLEEKQTVSNNTVSAPVRKKDSKKRKSSSPRSNLSDKYADSLFFAPPETKKSTKDRKSKKAKARKQPPTVEVSVKDDTRVKESEKSVACKSQCSCCKHFPCKVIVENSTAPPPQTTEKSLTQWIRVPSTQLRQCKTLNCVDILDELSFKDVEPIQSEYPRRDNVVIEECYPVEDSFLYKMVYGKNNDKILELLSTLDPPRIRCAGVCDVSCKPTKRKLEQKSPRRNGGREGENRVSRKELRALTKEDVAKKLRPYITDPNLRYRTTITVMPVKVFFDTSGVLTVTDEAGYEKSPRPNADYGYKAGDFSRTTGLCEVPTRGKTMSQAERKLWNRKYAKSVGQHLISFLEKQEPLYDANTGSEAKIVELSPEKLKKSYSVMPQAPAVTVSSRTPLSRRPQTGRVSSGLLPGPKQKSRPATARNKRDTKQLLLEGQVLTSDEQVVLENNIQKIIEMIEFKIVDILSVPDRQNADAFDAVEREIKEVLIKMKCVDKTCEENSKLEKKLQNLRLTPLDTIFDGDEWINDRKREEDASQTSDSGVISQLVQQVDEKDSKIEEVSQVSVTETMPSDEGTSGTDEKFVVTAVCSPEKAPIESKVQLSENTMEALEKISEIADKLQQQLQDPSSTSNEASTIDLDKYLQHIDKQDEEHSASNKNEEEDSKEFKGNDKHSSFHTILQFLDRLTDTYDESTMTTSHYSCLEQKADIIENPTEHYTSEILHPIEVTIESMESCTQTQGLIIDMPEYVWDKNKSINSKRRADKGVGTTQGEVSKYSEHAVALNMLYGAVFTCVYLALRLDFACNLP